MVSKMRAERIADRITEELSTMILLEVADPRLNGVSVTSTKVDRELSFADVYVSSLDGSERADEITRTLAHAAGYLRRELARKIDLRSFPRLRFHWDPSPEHADRIDRLIAELHKEQNKADEQHRISDNTDEQ